MLVLPMRRLAACCGDDNSDLNASLACSAKYARGFSVWIDVAQFPHVTIVVVMVVLVSQVDNN